MVDNSTKELDTIDSIWAVTVAGEKRRISYTLKYWRNEFYPSNFIILNFSKFNLENLEISISENLKLTDLEKCINFKFKKFRI